jgi:ribosome maturation factor RimP
VSSEPFEPLDSTTDFKKYLGRKVTLRYRLHDDAAHPVSEAVGVVMSVKPESGRERVVILTRGSEHRVVPVDDVMAGKAFPP